MSDQEIFAQRLEKITQLKQLGIDSYPIKFKADYTAEKILKELPTEKISAAGRIIALRKMGKAAFVHLLDSTGKIQIYVKQDNVGQENYDVFRYFDIGDFMGVTGTVFATKTGETTIKADSVVMLSKSLRPLPEKWHGLKDIETRYRQRYLDLISNEESAKTFRNRAKIISTIRKHLDNNNFMEVETPMMQSIPGGAAARPFITHHNALDIDLYLRIAPELYLKRLIVGGMERIYELGRTFRNEGMDIKHNPEFTILEIYQAYADYKDMMILCRDIFRAAASALKLEEISFGENKINLFEEWNVLSLETAFAEVGISFQSLFGKDSLIETGKKFGIENVSAIPPRKIFDHLFDKLIKPKLIHPTFITDWPKFLSPLAKSKKDNPEIVERFELYICSEEFANAYSELNDPVDQKSRFEQQVKEREQGDDEAELYDSDFIRALEHGMPPTGGLGIGVDRLIMLLTSQESIKDVILFPLLRPESNPDI
ncbi:MAG: Lysine--tRNA ligase [Elusimicrobia bacterium ADurb.Bin231]|nr:MAG: Lysine--tRNA ligase [Elusimicrobia bacterium ADurb.Bin231]